MQGATVMSAVWLTYWSEDKFIRAGDFYQGIYGMLGFASALFTLLTGFALTAMSVHASCELFDRSLRNLFRSPMSFFDTTPLGRILGIFGKDCDTMDSLVLEYLRLTVLVGAIVSRKQGMLLTTSWSVESSSCPSTFPTL